MELETDRVPIEKVRGDDTRFRISTDTDPGPIAASIQAVGLVNAPLFLKGEGAVTIVSGFRRVEACRRLGWRSLPGRFLPDRADPMVAIGLAIADNALQRSLNLVEQARCYALLLAGLGTVERVSERAPGLGLPADPPHIRHVVGICRLPLPVQEGLVDGGLSLSMAMQLSVLEPAVAVAFTRIFLALGLGLNVQRECLSRVTEISHREGIPVMQLLESREICRIVDAEGTDRGQKSRRLRSYLKARRFPHLDRAEKEMQVRIQQLKLGDGLSLKPPPHLESPVYTLELLFRSPDELNQRKAVLERTLANPAFRELFAG